MENFGFNKFAIYQETDGRDIIMSKYISRLSNIKVVESLVIFDAMI